MEKLENLSQNELKELWQQLQSITQEETDAQYYAVVCLAYKSMRIRVIPEFRTSLRLLEKLASMNCGKLHVYTTNYDCSYQVMAFRCENLSFYSHINNLEGVFVEKNWYKMNPNLQKTGLPSIYIHRLHGCVAWFVNESHTIELYGSGDDLEIRDDEYLHKMCIKLAVGNQIRANFVFTSAFEEFAEHLKHAKILLIWGHSFRDFDLLRMINKSFFSRRNPLTVFYLDSYMTEEEVVNNITRILGSVSIHVSPEFKPTRIRWIHGNEPDMLVTRVIETLKDGVK